MVFWPASLPKCSIPQGRSTTYARSAREFSPDDGRPIRRVTRSTADKIFGGTFTMTTAQLADFWTFWNETTNHGVSSFTMWDPDADANVTVIFDSIDPPITDTVLRGRHNVNLSFRVVG